MKKQLKETLKYSPNDGVAVTVSNEPTTDRKTGEIGYKQNVTINVIRPFESDKLSFADENAIREFLDNINLEDPQQELPLGSVTVKVKET